MCDLFSSEEKKAEEESFETDLIAGRLQEEVVRSDKHTHPSFFLILWSCIVSV